MKRGTGPDWPAGYGQRVLGEVDSTNAEAARIAGNLDGPEWILGLRQTAGRGRRGRGWADPEGNFAATLVLFPGEPAGRVALRSFVASLALLDAFVAVTGRPDGFALKWPNDVLLNGGKVAGILLEGAGQGQRLPGSACHRVRGEPCSCAQTRPTRWSRVRCAPPRCCRRPGWRVRPRRNFSMRWQPVYARPRERGIHVTEGFAPDSRGVA